MDLPKTISGWAIWLIVVLAICAVVYIAATAFGIPLPHWVIQVVGVIVVAVVLVAAIRFLGSLGGGT